MDADYIEDMELAAAPPEAIAALLEREAATTARYDEKISKVEELREKATKATLGPWYADGKNVRSSNEEVRRSPPVAHCNLTHGMGQAGLEDEANTKFIAAASPEFIIELCNRVLEAEGKGEL